MIEGKTAFNITQALVSNFQTDLVPSNLFRKAKLAILLSLVSISTNTTRRNRHSINILVVDDDDSLVSRLFRDSIKYSTGDEWSFSNGKYSKLVDVTKTSIHQTCFTKARNGVFISRLDWISKKDIESLKNCIDQTSFSIESENLKVTCKTNNAVWSFTRFNQTTFKRDVFGFKDFCKPALVPMLGKYDIALNICSSTDSKFDAEISSFIINKELNMEYVNQGISIDDFKDFIRFASCIRVELSVEAHVFLVAYFSALRNLHGVIVGGVDSMFLTLESLMRLTRSHAKLCLREVAIVDDAVIAVNLVEESMSLITGISLLNYRSLPMDQENFRFLAECIEEFAIHDQDEQEDVCMIRLFSALEKALVNYSEMI